MLLKYDEQFRNCGREEDKRARDKLHYTTLKFKRRTFSLNLYLLKWISMYIVVVFPLQTLNAQRTYEWENMVKRRCKKKRRDLKPLKCNLLPDSDIIYIYIGWLQPHRFVAGISESSKLRNNVLFTFTGFEIILVYRFSFPRSHYIATYFISNVPYNSISPKVSPSTSKTHRINNVCVWVLVCVCVFLLDFVAFIQQFNLNTCNR